MRPSTTVLTVAVSVVALRLLAADEATFDQRVKEATQNLESEAGRKYSDAFSKEFGAHYATRLSECLKQTGDPGAKDFEMLLKLAPDGHLDPAGLWEREAVE